jgi:tricorn protease
MLARILAVAALAALTAVAAGESSHSRPSFAEPSLSPDRSEIAFVSGGDVWAVPAAGGAAHLLASHPANESRPLYSPDGKRLAFMSNRYGNDDIFVLDLATGEIRRITYDDAADHLDAWSRDGKWLYLTSSSRDIAGMGDVYRVSAGGGDPMPVARDRFAAEYWGAPSPAGDVVAVTAKGIVAGQWWRRGHSHIDESEIWTIAFEGEHPRYDRVSEGGAKDAWPMWSADGKRLYFVSDRSGSENLWVREEGVRRARQLTNFTDGRLLWPSISYDGKAIVFERDFGIWRYDTASGKAAAVPISLRGAPAGPDVSRLSATNNFRDLALSPDGKKVVFATHGELFAASSKDGGAAARVTSTPAGENSPAWAPDSRRIAYVSDRAGAYHLYTYDFGNNTETQITQGGDADANPKWSPDGKLIAFVRGGRRIVVYDPASRQERVLATSYFGRPPNEVALEWSPDSQWLAFAAPGERAFQNIQVVPAAGGEPKPISFVPNTFVQSIAWSPDGTYLLFTTGQRTEPAMVVRIDLIPKTPKFREDEFRDLFKDEPKPQTPVSSGGAQTPVEKPEAGGAKSNAPPKVTIVFEGIRERARVLPIGLDADSIRISPDGKTLLLAADVAGQRNLYTYSLDELAKEPAVARQLTSTPAPKADPQWSPDSKQVFFLQDGRVESITVENRQSKSVAITAEMDVEFPQEKLEVFAQAWRYLNDNFYDPEFHGVDWNQVRARFEPQIAGAGTPDEERRLISLMIGELNASHLGISAGSGGSGAPKPVTGRLGLRFDRKEYESAGRLRIAEVINLSPAGVAGVKAGQYLLAVDGRPAGRGVNLDELLQHKVDRRVELTIADAADGAGKRVIPVKPVNTATEKRLLYRAWVESRREYVHRASHGRLGYVHMPDMSSNSLQQLYLDLDTENQARQGVVIDIRNNNGGFVNAYALDVLARRPYLTMTWRDRPAAPARSMLGQRALERLTILVVNQHSLSDAEDFTEGYRALKLGKVVGEPTAGWIIYTGGVQLIDGSVLRLPTIKITTADGSNMERNPRPVDIAVDRPLGESYSGADAQLDAAIRALLKEIGPAPVTSASR